MITLIIMILINLGYGLENMTKTEYHQELKLLSI